MAGLGYRHMLIILVSALVFTPAAWAMKAENFTFTHLGSKDGLCNQRIFSIVQTADGAIWWSSKSCIERYNGTNISHYTIGQQTKYSDFAGRNIRLVQSHDAKLICMPSTTTGISSGTPRSATASRSARILPARWAARSC